ncbi:MAG: DUF1553 domain-containing protein [Pirellulaceae bacterium]
MKQSNQRRTGSAARFTGQMVIVLAWAGIVIGTTEPLTAQTVDFQRDVAPIFREHCEDCHGPETQESGYRVDSRKITPRGGDLYPRLIIAGNATDSPLMKILSGTDPDLKMPPDGERLSDAELDILRRWINEGALWPENSADEDSNTKSLWSLEPVVRPSVPAIAANVDGIRNPIDAFIAASLRNKGLSLSPAADRRQLAKRLFLVTTGLPPTFEQVEAFASDSSPDAIEKLVDQLLGSPHCGEKWARQWLDAVRFAESDGFETNHDRPNAWRYRDYVIQSFNEDKSYFQFVREQIAGDQLQADVATGFLVGGGTDIVKGDADLTQIQRMNELADMVNTTSTAFMGLTVGCARCHNHKFDPMSQSDFYAMQAVFTGVHFGERDIASPDQPARNAEADGLAKELAKVESALAKLVRPAVTQRANIEHFSPVECRFVRFTITKSSSAEPCIDELEIFSAADPQLNVAIESRGVKASSSGNYTGDPQHQLPHINDGRYGNPFSWISSSTQTSWVQLEFQQTESVDRIVWSRDRRTEGQTFGDRLPIEYSISTSLDGQNWQVVATGDDRLGSPQLSERLKIQDPATARAEDLQLKRLLDSQTELVAKISRLRSLPKAYAGRFEPPTKTHRLHRGEHSAPREEVVPDGLAVLHPQLGSLSLSSDCSDAERRLALAQWITRPENPLTSRVMVNRLWQGVFGRGIVATPSDFGMMGASPTHPELLDWLAAELVEQKGSLKSILRLILTSDAFCQSSAPNSKGLKVDAQSHFLWRFPPRRLEGELIRDRILASSKQLDLKMGGPGFLLFVPNDNYARNWIAKDDFGPADFRRMIYATKLRMEHDAIFGSFDIPDAGQVCPSRSQSTTPIQSMNLFNSEFVWQQASQLADSIVSQDVAIPEQIGHVFRRVLLRDPDADEATAAQSLVDQHGLASLARALLNTNEFLFIE